MPTLLKVIAVLVVVLAVVAVVDYAVNRGESQVESALATVQEVAADQLGAADADPADGDPGLPAEDATAASLTASGTGAAAPSSPAVAAAPDPPTAIAPAEVTAVAIPLTLSPSPVADVLPASISAEGAAATRRALFVQGRTASWTTYEREFTEPVAIRAAGQIEAGLDISGPNGLSSSDFERALGNRARESRRVLPSAPYLALIGRVCSPRSCTEPFLVGSESVLCPSQLDATGALQLWTNNYVRVDGGGRTSLTFTQSTGGYSVYIEPAAVGHCEALADGPAGLAMSNDADVLTVGGTLRHPEFVVPSSRSSWKPFFVPLGAPLRIRATGSMQPLGGAESTGPEGIVVPAVSSWHYPGQPTIVVDAERRLFAERLPYQALIGRLCGRDGCDAPFLVGTETVICPAPPYDGRVELWVNHIVGRGGLLSGRSPVTFDAFDLQQRIGSYTFEISRALMSECGG